MNQVVLNAATPALDRAKAKIEDVLAKLAGSIPSDNDLYTYFTNNSNKTYTLGDETQLEVVVDFGNGQDAAPGSQPPLPDGKLESLSNKLATSLNNDETLTSAWKFPSDTDNNGLFDSYTLYGIYYRSPTYDTTTGNFNRPRNALNARTPPMSGGTIGGQCPNATGTSASFVGTSSWYKAGANLAKSFFVYTATVPITTLPTNPPVGNANQYEKYTGTQGFSALEYQQDRVRIPLTNNAVVYQDDVELTPGPTFRLNGRLVTNSNLLLGNFGNGVYLYQVSSPYSCYYQEENSRIVVGGNVAAAGIIDGVPDNNYQPVNVDLFQGVGKPPGQDVISSTNRSTSNPAAQVSYNSQAYTQRLARLVAAQIANDPIGSTDPSVVQSAVTAAAVTGAPASQQSQVRQTQLQSYFTNLTRRVPSLEVPYTGDALGSYATSNPLQGSGDTLRPIDAWAYPTNPNDGITGTGYTGLSLQTSQLQATQPQQQKQLGTEQYLGDRIQVGNNLPALWFNNGLFANANTQQNLSNVNWTAGSGTRYRQTQVQTLANLGITDRDGDWEQAAAAKPTTPLDNNGGLRVVTGAGVYERKNSFLPTPYYYAPTSFTPIQSTTYDDPATPTVEAYPMVWPDSMPMSPGAQVSDNTSTPSQWTALPTSLPAAVGSNTSPHTTIDPSTPKYAKGDLRMRATVVYHYAQSTYNPKSPTSYQTPIACVSSYYDPTNSTTATLANSNNGVAYPAPTTNASSLTGVSAPNAIGLFGSLNNGDENSTTLLGRLYYQANLRFPSGRVVNQLLRDALNAKASNQNLTLSQQSAIDSTICALQILDGTLSPSTTFIPNNAIREIAFLDARQIQAIDKDDTSTYPVETFTTDGNPNILNSLAKLTGKYDLDVEKRQPLEIRATMLDLNLLRQQTISGPNVLAPSEYLLPNTGIIYASRDDALLDLSDKSVNADGSANMQARQLLSPTDFKLDPTRRPNGILLTNGSNLSRSPTFQAAEKGLILATNLPAYVQGDFNIHSGEEFINTLASDWSNFYTRTAAQINPNFACRQGDPRLPKCTTGDQWRTATILADAVTLLSNNFKFGFRNHGDYDLRNNNGNQDSINKLLYNGFWYNNFVTNGLSSGGLTVSGLTPQDTDYVNGTNNVVDSSYFNNFVTPIQRRGNFPEYVMELCRKLPVSECQPTDWVLGTTANPNAMSIGVVGKLANTLIAGTTARPTISPVDQRYARRVAFLRDSSGKLLADNKGQPIPLGIKGSSVNVFPYNSVPSTVTSIINTANILFSSGPDSANNALWFRDMNYLGITAQPNQQNQQNGQILIYSLTSTFNSGGYVAYQPASGPIQLLDGQPLLVPVLQFQNTTNSGLPLATSTNAQGSNVISTKWIQQATQTTFNLAAAAGDTPARANSTTQVYESNGGLYNFVRFLENWQNTTTARISGSFIQLKRSAYATAPWGSVLPAPSFGPPTTGGAFVYPQGYRSGYGLLGFNYGWDYLPFYVAPNREWGFDVALLSQSPDLFAQKLTLAPTSPPNEFFREVNQDDPWIQTLLCAAQKDSTGKYSSYAVDANQLPSCQLSLSSYP